MNHITTNETTRLAALIAGPLRREGASPKVAEPTVRAAVAEFTKAYRRSLGVVVTPEQQDEITASILDKLKNDNE